MIYRKKSRGDSEKQEIFDKKSVAKGKKYCKIRRIGV
jgi:hypothetical protein